MTSKTVLTIIITIAVLCGVAYFFGRMQEHARMQRTLEDSLDVITKRYTQALSDCLAERITQVRVDTVVRVVRRDLSARDSIRIAEMLQLARERDLNALQARLAYISRPRSAQVRFLHVDSLVSITGLTDAYLEPLFDDSLHLSSRITSFTLKRLPERVEYVPRAERSFIGDNGIEITSLSIYPFKHLDITTISMYRDFNLSRTTVSINVGAAIMNGSLRGMAKLSLRSAF